MFNVKYSKSQGLLKKQWTAEKDSDSKEEKANEM
jgi:hypothetical protein